MSRCWWLLVMVMACGSAPADAVADASTTPAAVEGVQAGPRQIVQTGSLLLGVADVGVALSGARTLAEELGGRVERANHAPGERASANLVVRVPADRFAYFGDQLAAGALEVVNRREETEDVTGEVADLDARIANQEALELRLRALLSQAADVEAALAVETELAKVREGIDAARGARALRLGQVAMSTWTVTLSQVGGGPVTLDAWAPMEDARRATEALVSGLQALGTAAIWAAIAGAPLLALTLGPVWWWLRRRPRAA